MTQVEAIRARIQSMEAVAFRSKQMGEAGSPIGGAYINDVPFLLKLATDLAEALDWLLTAGGVESGGPAWGHYRYEDVWRCSYCESYGASPYDEEELAAIKHEDGCRIPVLQALLASPDTRALLGGVK